MAVKPPHFSLALRVCGLHLEEESREEIRDRFDAYVTPTSLVLDQDAAEEGSTKLHNCTKRREICTHSDAECTPESYHE